MNIPTVNEIKDTFHYQVREFNINREYPTKSQMQEVRRKFMKNLTKLSCLETDFDNFKWAILLVKPQEFVDNRRVKINIERLTEAMDNARTALAGEDPPGDPDTVTEESVEGDWTPVTNTNPEVQLTQDAS